MQQSMHRPLMSESTFDATLDSKRRRVDLGMPRGVLAGLSGKGDTNGILNGTNDMMMDSAAGNAADLLRKMLHNHGHSEPLVVPDLKKTAPEMRDEPSFKDDEKMITNGNTKDKIVDGDDDDDKSSDGTEPMESGNEDGEMTRVKGYNTSMKENGDIENQNGSTIEDDLKAKRARVENIITSMRKSPTPHSHSDQMAADAPEAKRQKRKQCQPQPQRTSSLPAGKKNGRRNERRKLKELLGHLQQQLDVLQEKYIDLYEEDNSSLSDDGSDDLDDLREPIDTLSAIRKCEKKARAQAKKRAIAENAALLVGKGGSLRLRDTLKKELVRSVYSTVDNIVEEFASKHTSTAAPTQNQYSNTATPEIADTVPVLQFPNNPQQSPSSNRSTRQTTPHKFDEEQTEAISLVVPHRSRIPKASPTLERSRTSSPATPNNSQITIAEAASDMLRHPFMPPYLPTSVAIPNPSLNPFTGMSMVSNSAPETNGLTKEQKDVHDELRYTSSPLLSYPHHHPAFLHGSPGAATDPSGRSELTPMGHDSFSDSYSQIKLETESARGSPDLSNYSRPNGASLISTLTPTHLRKAKLMFFFVRYPSSALLRQHFPDVQFNRHNTSQIIKWFSNFREFYYIQMEKFARQAVSDGVEDAETLVVTRESELYRVLSLHYNKSNDFQVPDGFLKVSNSTLKEFFVAIKSGKDVEPSWKKTIYKVIGKLDEVLPEFFKSSTCLEELEC